MFADAIYPGKSVVSDVGTARFENRVNACIQRIFCDFRPLVSRQRAADPPVVHAGETPALPNTWIPACAGMTKAGGTGRFRRPPAGGAA